MDSCFFCVFQQAAARPQRITAVPVLHIDQISQLHGIRIFILPIIEGRHSDQFVISAGKDPEMSDFQKRINLYAVSVQHRPRFFRGLVQRLDKRRTVFFPVQMPERLRIRFRKFPKQRGIRLRQRSWLSGRVGVYHFREGRLHTVVSRNDIIRQTQILRTGVRVLKSDTYHACGFRGADPVR